MCVWNGTLWLWSASSQPLCLWIWDTPFVRRSLSDCSGSDEIQLFLSTSQNNTFWSFGRKLGQCEMRKKKSETENLLIEKDPSNPYKVLCTLPAPVSVIIISSKPFFWHYGFLTPGLPNIFSLKLPLTYCSLHKCSCGNQLSYLQYKIFKWQKQDNTVSTCQDRDRDRDKDKNDQPLSNNNLKWTKKVLTAKYFRYQLYVEGP